ncbi:MAG: TatD family hydrolase [Phycisphaerales bacterium]|nr:TatD family hydrolase [Phycisphaerales bacterium]
MLDTHCHLTSKEFTGRVPEVLADAAAAGVHGVITIATTSSDCLAARQLAQSHPNVWFSAGIHPLHSDEPINWADVQSAAAHPKCVAWGELGLDHHYDRPPRALQNKILAEELAFIEATHRRDPSLIKPIIVHCRDAFDDLISIFADFRGFDPTRFVFHCFTGTPDDARKVLDFGAWISFTGIVTFENAREVAEAAKLVPADRIMVETDSPFLSPEPVRKIRPNEPKHVIHTARRLAHLRGVDPMALEHQLDANAQRFFNIKIL